MDFKDWDDIDKGEESSGLDDLHSDDDDDIEMYDESGPAKSQESEPNTDIQQDFIKPINEPEEIINKGLRDQRSIKITDQEDDIDSKWDKYRI